MEATQVKPNTKVQEVIARRSASREQAGDEQGLRALYIAAIEGAETVALAFRGITGEDIAQDVTGDPRSSDEILMLREQVAALEQQLLKQRMAGVPLAKPASTVPDPDPEEQDRYERRVRDEFISAETRDLFTFVIENGGIRPSTPDLREEYREIPKNYRRKDGMPGDEMAELLATHRPELRIESERDLLEFFAARRRQARHARAA